MANTLKPKRSSVAGNIPTTTNLTSGELGVNMADQKVWINNGTSVVQIGSGKLSGLADVVLSSLATGQGLSWNGTNWVNSSAGSGTVTSVSGTGTVSGLTLSGTVTGSGNLTLSGAITGFLPLTGGTLSGAFLDFSNSNPSLRITSGPGTFNIGDDDIVNLASGAVVATPSSRATSGVAILSTFAYGVSQGDNKTHFGYNTGSSYVNYIRGAATYFDSGTVQIAGSQVLHAGNFSSYAPSLSSTYADPAWITSLASSKLTGTIDNARLNGGTYTINVTGNAGTATTLQTARTINGVSFNGSANITVADSTKLPLSGGTLSGGLVINSGSTNQLQLNTSTETQSLWIRAGYDSDGSATPAVSAFNVQFQSSGSSGGTFSFVSGNTKVLAIEGSAVNSLVPLQQSGNQVLHAGNYSTYSPSYGYFDDYQRGAYRVIADHGSQNTWYIRSNGRFTWARAHDWSQSFDLDLGSGTTNSNDGWARFGQQTSNSTAGTWRGTRFVQYTGGTSIDGFVRAGRYYLGDDSNYMLNAGDGSLRVQTVNGYIDIGPKNSSWCHIYSDRDFYTNRGIWINGSRVLDAGNYTSYSPSLTGSGASGTWGINVTGSSASTTGNAATATALQTARTINGVSFNGTANITITAAANGGTAANITGQANSATITASTGVNASQIVQRDGNGYIYANHINFSTSESENPTISSFITGNGDGWSRKSSLQHVKNSIRGVADGTWGISVTGNAATATTLQTARNINGISFNGSANIDTTEWFHSDRDFPNGTLITTNINYAVTNGDPFVLEIRGNSYGNIVPVDLIYQGYIYADTIINHGGVSNGINISGLVAINNGGNLCFWFPSQGYWNGYNVKVYSAYATRATNRVTSITGVAKPTTAKEVALSANIRQSIHSGNVSSYALSASGGTINGNGTLDFGPNSSWGATLRVGGNGHSGATRASVVTTNGNLHLDGTTNSGVYLSWYNSGTTGTFFGNGAGGQVGRVDGGGNATFSGNVSAASDERLKTDWEVLPADYIERLAKVKSGTYTRLDSGARQAGASAQDMQKLLKETVMTADDEAGTLSLAYGNAALVSAIELAKDNVDLRARVAKLEALVSKLIEG